MALTLMSLTTVAADCDQQRPAAASALRASADTAVPAGMKTQRVEVVNVFPHDPGAFTQGLVWHNGALYEGTGLEGKSSLRRVDLPTGAVLQRVTIDSQYFAEGVALLRGKLYQLTWKSGKAFVYDVESLTRTATLSYSGEGWGLTSDGTSLIMSDGSSRLRVLDPATFSTVRWLDVTASGQPVRDLNELEFVRGEIWANIWQSDQIVRIDPSNGSVRGWVDLSGLLSPADRAGASVDVLNGIAYDPDRDRLFVTGKLWPKLFEIRLRD
jgi:glutamine cyclotransferase